jgi:hypothetical protein
VCFGRVPKSLGEFPGEDVALHLHHLQPQGRRPRLHHTRRLRMHFDRQEQLPTLDLPERHQGKNIYFVSILIFTKVNRAAQFELFCLILNGFKTLDTRYWKFDRTF